MSGGEAGRSSVPCTCPSGPVDLAGVPSRESAVAVRQALTCPDHGVLHRLILRDVVRESARGWRGRLSVWLHGSFSQQAPGVRERLRRWRRDQWWLSPPITRHHDWMDHRCSQCRRHPVDLLERRHLDHPRWLWAW